jgi:hypothetical protein
MTLLEPITEEWLREVGFRWYQFDLQPDKQWLLWLGTALAEPGGWNADSIRRNRERLDQRLLRSGRPWREAEKDESRGSALPEIKNGDAQ